MSRRGALRVLMLGALLIVVLPVVAEDVGSSKAGPHKVSLNQAVSLEEIPATPAKQQGGPDIGATTETAENTKASTSSLKPRTIRRSASTEGVTDRLGATTTSIPWYRTGYGALAIVLALVGAATYAARRWIPTVRMGENDLLRVVGRANITPKHNVALVHLGRRFVMVGVSGDRLTALCQIDDPDEVADLMARVGASRVPRVETGFESVLVSQADEYESAAANANDSPTPPVNHTPDGSAAGDLLRKLRAMQIQ